MRAGQSVCRKLPGRARNLRKWRSFQWKPPVTIDQLKGKSSEPCLSQEFGPGIVFSVIKWVAAEGSLVSQKVGLKPHSYPYSQYPHVKGMMSAD